MRPSFEKRLSETNAMTVATRKTGSTDAHQPSARDFDYAEVNGFSGNILDHATPRGRPDRALGSAIATAFALQEIQERARRSPTGPIAKLPRASVPETSRNDGDVC